MSKRFIVPIVAASAAWLASSAVRAQLQPWNNAGLAQARLQPAGTSGPAPRRDLTGIWDAGGAGIGARGATPAPLTQWGEALGKTHKAGDGIRQSPIEEINDPL